MRLLQTRSGFVFYTLDRQPRWLYFDLLCLFPNILKILAKCTHAAPRDIKTLFQTLFERIALKIAKGKTVSWNLITTPRLTLQKPAIRSVWTHDSLLRKEMACTLLSSMLQHLTNEAQKMSANSECV